MHIEELLHHLEPDQEISVLNEPFTFTGKVRLTLDGGDTRYWLFSRDDKMLTVAPGGEELIFFEQLDAEFDPQDETVLYQGEEYEFSYEDAGTVEEVVGETGIEEECRYSFSDYESDEGEILRIVRNENTGETFAYWGIVVVEEEIMLVG